jgi:site-specific DNA-cytosine methylase
MSCGQLALDRAHVKYDKYFASEIDKPAIKVTMHNYPDTIQLGSVVDVNTKKLPKIDLLIGGSPCQSFSFVGKRLGMSTKCKEEILTLEQYLDLKMMSFEFEGQSYLFWEYVRILEELRKVNPEIKFMLENVKMHKNWEHVITNTLGVEPVKINSALVSAQTRTRLYWTNISDKIEQPIDKGIFLQDIFETDHEVLRQYKVNNTPSRRKMWGHGINGQCKNVTDSPKSSCMLTKQDRRPNQGLIEFEDFCRFFTPLENERLQTVPEGYTNVPGITDLNRDFMLGNGWTIDVIAHIFSYLHDDILA